MLSPLITNIHTPSQCYVVRQDRQPLTREAIEIMYHFNAYLLNTFDVLTWKDAPITREAFRVFSDKYRSDQIAKGRVGFEFFPYPE